MEEYYDGAETSPHNCRDRETQLYRHSFASWDIILAPGQGMKNQYQIS